MKLNLWMIANRLTRLKPEIHVPEYAPAELLSARLVETPHCVYIYQKGTDVICSAGETGGYLLFHGAFYQQILDIVQAVFDYYQEWYEMLEEADKVLDYIGILDRSWQIVRNPIILLDGSNKVLYMSSQYLDKEVNNDWVYLRQYGQSSVKVIDYLIEAGKSHEFYMSSKAQIYHFPNSDIHTNMVSAALYRQDTSYGRINVIEFDRKLNPGDVYIVDILAEHLSRILGQRDSVQGNLQRYLPYFTKMLLGQSVSDTEIEYWKKYTCWTDKQDYRIYVLNFRGMPGAGNSVRIRDYVQKHIPQCLAVPVEGEVAFALSDFQRVKIEADHILVNLQKRYSFQTGISLPFRKLEKINYYFEQAVWSAQFGKGDFYLDALSYIIQNKMEMKTKYACHPDMLALYERQEKDCEDDLDTYYCYLQNHRAISQTARKLFVHKNTLIYRIKKIERTFRYLDSSEYTLHYMLLSMYILQLLSRGSLPRND